MLGRISLAHYPNREFRLTLTPEKPPSRRKTDESHSETELPPVKAVRSTCHPLKTQNRVLGEGSGVQINQRKKAGHGAVGRQSPFSTYARHAILRSGGALEHLYQPQQCLFLTMTLPGSTDAAMRAIAEWSGYLVDRFKSWLSKRVNTRLEMYVWEFQRRGALHLHYLIGCPERAIGEQIRQSLQGQWIRLLDNVCEKSGVDVYAKNAGFSHKHNKKVVRVDAQWCEKSVAAYLSKYVSKESRKNRKRVSNRYYPSRWYGVSRPLLELTRNLTKEVAIYNLNKRDWLRCYEDVLSVLQPNAVHCYSYRHRIGSGKSIVAYVEDSIKDSIWNQTMTNLPSTQDSFSSAEKAMMQTLSRALYLMNRNWKWRSCFYRLSSNYVKTLVSSLQSSVALTPADTIFLLDTFIFSLEYLEQNSPSIPVALKQFLSHGKEIRRQSIGQSLSNWNEWTEVKLAHTSVDKRQFVEQAGTNPNEEPRGEVQGSLL